MRGFRRPHTADGGSGAKHGTSHLRADRGRWIRVAHQRCLHVRQL